MAVNEGDKATPSLGDILGDELQEAMLVLAGSDPDKCSYPEGYVKRQAVFACNTCTPSGSEPAGLCLACTNKCHDGHDIFDLYTKRNFRCDCGNGKFGEFQCTLIPSKDSQNIKNQYNHNFHGLYCSCDRSSDDQVDEEMIQCVVCEDWFHSKHLGCTVEDSEELEEMVCETCMNRTPFLWTYAAHIAAPPVVKLSPCKEEVEVNVEEDGRSERCEPCATGGEGSSTSTGSQELREEARDENASRKRARHEMSGSPAKCRAKTGACRLKELQARGLERSREGAVFWPYHWRSRLCTCISCKRAYVEAGVQFLLDESDTLLAYENKGRTETFGDLLMSCLGSLDHVQQLEIVYHFNDLKTELIEFLQPFASEGKVVTAEDIQQFFDELRAKRRRTNGEQNDCN